MNYILDILAVIIIACSVISGHKKGFVKTVLKLCSGIICLILAISLSPTVGTFINDNCVAPIFENIVSEKMESIAPSQAEEVPDVNKLVEDEPNEFLQILEKYNIDFSAFKDFFYSFGELDPKDTAGLAVEYVAKPVSETVSYVIAFVLILIVSSLLMSVLSFILDKIVKLPVLRTANKFLGIICGAFFGVLWVYVLATILEYSLPYITNSATPVLSQLDPSKTLIFHYFYCNNPISEIIKALF